MFGWLQGDIWGSVCEATDEECLYETDSVLLLQALAWLGDAADGAYKLRNSWLELCDRGVVRAVLLSLDATDPENVRLTNGGVVDCDSGVWCGRWAPSKRLLA